MIIERNKRRNPIGGDDGYIELIFSRCENYGRDNVAIIHASIRAGVTVRFEFEHSSNRISIGFTFYTMLVGFYYSLSRRDFSIARMYLEWVHRV